VLRRPGAAQHPRNASIASRERARQVKRRLRTARPPTRLSLTSGVTPHFQLFRHQSHCVCSLPRLREALRMRPWSVPRSLVHRAENRRGHRRGCIGCVTRSGHFQSSAPRRRRHAPAAWLRPAADPVALAARDGVHHSIEHRDAGETSARSDHLSLRFDPFVESL
jgi:hypothetical protein